MAVFQSIRNLFISSEAAEPETITPAPPSTYQVRPLTLRQIGEVLRLNSRCFRNGENYTRHTFSYLLNEPATLSYRVVDSNQEMVGFVFVMLNKDGAAHLTTIGVAPEHRGRGIARKMLAHLEKVLKEKRISTIVLEVRVSNIPAQHLYRRAGYTAVQKLPAYYSNGEDGYLMVKSLTEVASA